MELELLITLLLYVTYSLGLFYCGFIIGTRKAEVEFQYQSDITYNRGYKDGQKNATDCIASSNVTFDTTV